LQVAEAALRLTARWKGSPRLQRWLRPAGDAAPLLSDVAGRGRFTTVMRDRTFCAVGVVPETMAGRVGRAATLPDARRDTSRPPSRGNLSASCSLDSTVVANAQRVAGVAEG